MSATNSTRNKDSWSEANTTAMLLLNRVTLGKASELARTGNYAEAESLLSDLINDGSTNASAFDLLARIKAQQGRLYEAESLWKKAAKINPDNQSYTEGLRRIANMKRYPIWLAVFFHLLVVIVVVIGIIAFFVLFKSVSERTVTNTNTSTITSSSSTQSSPVVQHEVPTTSSKEETPFNMELNVKGFSLKKENADFVGTFDEGLFVRGISLKPEAEKKLSELGQQLKSFEGRVTVRVVGQTDNIPVPAGRAYRDNVALGLARAMAVVEKLRSSYELPAEMFLIGSKGEMDAPFPNDTPEHRENNQTVVLRISKIQQ